MYTLPRGCFRTTTAATTFSGNAEEVATSQLHKRRHELLMQIHAKPEPLSWAEQRLPVPLVTSWRCEKCGKAVTTIQCIRRTIGCTDTFRQHTPLSQGTTISFCLVPHLEIVEQNLPAGRCFPYDYPSLLDLLRQPVIELPSDGNQVQQLNIAQAYIQGLHAQTAPNGLYEIRGTKPTYAPDDAKLWQKASDGAAIVEEHEFLDSIGSHEDAYMPQASVNALVKFVPFSVFTFK
jgi:hypothetical protein